MTNNQILYVLCIVIKNTISQIVYNNELQMVHNEDLNNGNLKNIMNGMEPHLQLVYSGDPTAGYILYQKLPTNNIPNTIQPNNDNSNKMIASECNQCVYPEGCCQNQCPECQNYGSLLLSQGYKINYQNLPALGNNLYNYAQNQANINQPMNQPQSFLVNPPMILNSMNANQNQLNVQRNQFTTQLNMQNPQMNSKITKPMNSQQNFLITPEPSILANSNIVTQQPLFTTDKVDHPSIPNTINPVAKTNDLTEVILKEEHKVVKSYHNEFNSTLSPSNYSNTINLYKANTSNSSKESTTAKDVPYLVIYKNEHQPNGDLDYSDREVEKEIEVMSPNKEVLGKPGEVYHEETGNTPEYYDDDEEKRVLSTYAKNSNHIRYDPYVMVRRTIKNRLPESEILFSRMKDLKLKRAMLPNRKTV